MGFFDFLKKNKEIQPVKEDTTLKRSIPESERKFYQPDDYYTDKAFENTPFEKKVITFEERKRISVPSTRGLYVAEILLLEYCSYGQYPKPSNGYPGFWWFEYGIRNVLEILESLEARGYIKYCSPKDAIKSLKVAELKELLQKNGFSTTGKKEDLIEKVKKSINDDKLIEAGVVLKYELTELGQKELAENEYVPYMHKHPRTTVEDSTFGSQFNVWSINKILNEYNMPDWKSIVDNIEKNIAEENEQRYNDSMEKTKLHNPEMYAILRAQDEQFEEILKVEKEYEINQEIEPLLDFWEKLWANGGLKFEGSYWHFRLADLYIKKEKYEEAIKYCEMIKNKKIMYVDKANAYIRNIEKAKNKKLKAKS